MMTTPARRRFGLNYVPSRNWYYLWNEWDAAVVRDDFAAMAELGIDHIRVQLLWPYFQPNEGAVSGAHLDRLDELMEMAARARLDVLLCPLTGWLSGYRFLPPGVEADDIFLKPETFVRIQRYFEAVLQRVGPRGNFIGFDLGNEINVMVSGLPSRKGDAWGRKLCSWLRPKMKGRWIVNGIDHMPWFQGGVFGVRHLVEDYDAVCIHAWPFFTGCLERGGLDDPHSANLAAFLTRYCRSHMKRGKEKPVWIQEFGCSSLWGALPERKSYMEATIRSASAAGATWFTWWCSHDIERRYRFDPLEYDLGLLTTGNKVKPLGRLYQKLIAGQAGNPEPSAGEARAFPDWDERKFTPGRTARLPRSQWVRQNLKTTTWALFEEYLAAGRK
ncbi:MAG TPA: hypothetical protein VIM58_02655 [Candidatus Methylacidiphilales bacterium]